VLAPGICEAGTLFAFYASDICLITVYVSFNVFKRVFITYFFKYDKSEVIFYFR